MFSFFSEKISSVMNMNNKENVPENFAGSAVQDSLLNDCVKTKMNAVLSKNEIKKLDKAKKNAETGRIDVM